MKTSMHLICLNPPIKFSLENDRIIRKLFIAKLAIIRGGYYEVNWDEIKRIRIKGGRIQRIGKKYGAIVDAWMELAKPDNYSASECPICRKFHEHNHGGLT